jgi:glycine/D-amino acid oxidase-like deaminating enzyme
MVPTSTDKNLAVIGAGFYGLYSALTALNAGWRVTVFEARKTSMDGASAFNQARIHGGYHYPRALTTAKRSRFHYPTFCADFPDAVIENSLSTYLIAKNSKVTAKKFERFSWIIGAPLQPVSNQVRNLIDWNSVEAGYQVQESVFDSSRIRYSLMIKIQELGGNVFFETKVLDLRQSIDEHGGGHVDIITLKGEERFSATIICTYGFSVNLANDVSFRSEIEAEICEMVVVDLPSELSELAITVMDGPFWSMTPYPLMKGHVLSSVRHTPHQRFRSPDDANEKLSTQRDLLSRGDLMLRDSSKHLPLMKGLKIRASLWGVKVIPNTRDFSDARPILVKQNKRIISILGSKLDNVYDASAVVSTFLNSILSGK